MDRKPRDFVIKAMAQMQTGLLSEAEATLRQGLRRTPREPQAAHLLGMLLSQSGRGDQAEFFLKAAVRDEPKVAAYRTTLGNHFAMAGKQEEAVEAFRAALALEAGYGPAQLGLSLSLVKLGDFAGAERAGREAVRLQPGMFQPYVNLASGLRESGRAGEALDVLSEALGRFPNSVPVITALLVVQNYVPGVDRAAMREMALRLARLLPPPFAEPLTNTREPERRLRVAYISGDLRLHSVAFFLEPILAERDREAFEVVCYATEGASDAMTQRLQSLSDGWVDARALSGDAFARRLRQDGVDIAVDLAGHTHGSRALALARRGAPVQVTYLGYPGTTGVPQMDYRIVDWHTDPAEADAAATERLIRLEGCFLTYRAPADAPAAGDRAGAGPVTFGSFNSMGKISPQVLDAWAAVLRQAPESRLVLKNKALADGALRGRISGEFASRGVEAGRLELLPPAKKQVEHLEVYRRIDIALDTFPYNGTTTTCEALWMGVPVVALEGATHAGRVGVSLLRAAGLERLIAKTPEEFVAVASRLAQDRGVRGAALREQVRTSPLCDAAAFTRRFEGALREMWRAWCRGDGLQA